MSGFDLLAPAGLLALIAIPLVVLFHMRHTTPVVRDVPSLRFWRQATREETHEERFKRPPINLLFLLHILLVAAIAFALTRPAVSSALGGLGSRTEPRHVILLLDGSTSMAARDTASGETRFAEAAKVADEQLAALQNGDVATVVLMGTHSTTLAANDPEGIRAVRERLATTPLPGGRVDLDDALTLVKDLLLPSMRDEIVVVTDGALAADPSVVSEIGAAIELVRVGGDIADNVAITDIATRGSPSNPGEQQLYARLVNFGAAAISAPVVILADGIELSRADVTVPPAGGVQEITQTLPEGAATVTVRLELTDALADDNIASSVLVQGEEFGLRILLVSDIPTALQRALAVLPGSEITLRSPVEAAAARDLGSFDLVVYEHELPATRFPDAPVLIVDPPEAGLLPTRGVMANPTAIRIRAQDPLLTGVELAGVTFGQAPVIVLDGGSTEIVGAESGPLIFRGTTPDSDQPMIVLAFDVAESNLPQRVAFPILVANIANELAPSPLPASAPLGEPIIYRPHGAAASIRITNPAGEQIDLPLATAESETTFDAVREIAFADTGTVGEYRVEELDTAGNVLAGGRFIVNAGHVRESDLTPNADLGNILAGSDAGADGGSGESLSDLWPVLVAAAFALLLIEWILTLLPRRRRRPVAARPVGAA